VETPDMLIKVFISWSGPKSKEVALAMRDWLPNVVQFIEPWMSSEDIDKGSRWNSDVATELEQANIGIICLTPENLDSPWILFEAGALSKTLSKTFVCPYLCGVDPKDLRGPLLQFQATVANKKDTHKLLCTICKALEGAYLSESRLREAFEHWWPSLEQKLSDIDCCGTFQKVPPVRRSDRELIEELLELVRRQALTPEVNPAAMIPHRVPSTRSSNIQSYVTKKGVINPAIFAFLGKKMRMAFLSTNNSAEVGEKLEGADFEALTTFGPHDLIITHVNESRYEMMFDIRSKIPSGINFESERTEDAYNDFPLFDIDEYLKVLGVPIERADLAVFSDPNIPIPSVEELTKVMMLGADWDDVDVSKEERNRFLSRKWILSVTAKQPGNSTHIITILLAHAGPHMEDLFSVFDQKVIPDLVNTNIVNSIYRGSSRGLAIHYVLRVSADADSLYTLISRLHALALEARILITTKTYVVVRRESPLSLQRAVLVPNLPSDVANFRNTYIAPRLSVEDRTRLVYLPQDIQAKFIAQYRRVQEGMSQLADLRWFQERREEIERNLAKGLLNGDFTLLRSPHDILLHRVETVLRGFIDEEIKDEQLETWKELLQIPQQKSRRQLSFTEQIKLTTLFLESDSAHPELLESVKNLMDKTPSVRNALAHDDLERLTTESFVEALTAYCNFLSRWDHEFNY
jgi:hypothetical protein